jgi:hypothetical protein
MVIDMRWPGRRSWLLIAVASTLIGCGGNPEELRSAEQSTEFIRDIARGGKIGEWTLADNATVEAIRAWTHRGTVQDLGKTLRDRGPEWACETAERVERAHKVIHGIGLDVSVDDRRAIVASAMEEGASEEEVNALIDRAVQLTSSELVEATAAACSAAKEL